MEGWIKIHRKIQDNWLWQEKRKFSKFEAWMSLLLKANHKENKILFGNKIINIEAGSFITSEVKLADEWGWSRITVHKFLVVLQNDKMIVKKGTTKYTSISIENWALYQFQEQQNIQQNIQQSNIKVCTNKNIKNDKNIYLNLFNKYKSEIQNANSREKILIIGKCKECEEYSKLTLEEQDQLFLDLMSINKRSDNK